MPPRRLYNRPLLLSLALVLLAAVLFVSVRWAFPLSLALAVSGVSRLIDAAREGRLKHKNP